MRIPRRGDDSGFAMVFVLMVIGMVTVAVATVLTVTTPDISRTRQDQDGQGAGAAARAAVDDFIAYVSGIDACRSTTRVCAQAKGAVSAVKTIDPASGATMSWTTDRGLTTEGYVRVHATGTYGRATRTLDADISLAPSILSYGYYSDYESQSSDALQRIYKPRAIRIDKQSVWQSVSVATLSAASTASWATPTSTNVCDRHWWADNSTTPATDGRGTAAATWSSRWSFDTTSRTGTYGGGCDIIFASGMTLDGPVYTRDALFIDGSGGSGPLFQQAVLTGWGYAGRNNPTVPATKSGQGPWRQQNNGTLAASPVKPKKADFDLELPDGIGTEGVSDNACVYTGPTRVKLNGDGTATVTSPRTTAKATGADPACYPAVVGATGITAWKIAYGTVGGGTVLVRNIGTEPATGFPLTGQRSTTTPTAATSTFWNTNTGGTASNGTSAAPDTCSASPYYSAAVNSTCAWTETPNYTATTGTTDGWTKYTTTGSCGTTPAFGATDQRQFECEYAKKIGGTPTFATFRTNTRTALTSSTCATVAITTANRETCLKTLLTGLLPTATTSVRYVVTAATGSTTAGTTRALAAAAPAYPQASDPIFANGPSTTGAETSSYAPVTLTVTRQTSTNGTTWTGDTTQFKLTVTSTTWAVSTPASSTSYFPAVNDATQYGSSTGSSVAGDLYVEGTNKGRLSLLADNDVVVTNNVLAASTDITQDGLNMVAGHDVRNYHPVSCVDTTAASVNATAPGYCPNDITGLGNPGASGSTWDPDHPALQYNNLQAAGTRTIAAAIFALEGSLSSDNYNRGNWMGALQINGGVYQQHRGVNGTQQGSGTSIARTGYLLQYHYVDLRQSNLPYEPTTKVKSGRVWSVVSVSGSGAS